MPIRLLLAGVVFSNSLLWSQSVSVDWPNRTMLGCNAVSGTTRSVVVTLYNINDHLYDYRMEFDVQAAVPNDFAFLQPPHPSAGARLSAVLEQVEAALQVVATAIKGSDALTAKPGADGKFRSVKIGETQGAWRSLVEASPDYPRIVDNLSELRNGTFLPGDPSLENRRITALSKADNLLQMGDRILKGPHRKAFSVPITAGTDNTIKIQVSELVGSQITGTMGKPEEFTCVIKSSVLSLSAGVLISTVGAREYSVRAVPKVVAGVTQNETFNALTIENKNNLQPTGVALLNYQLGKLDWIGLSAGPTFRLGGVSGGTSTFGFFSGVSLNLWKRFFLTPGAHLGQFADFPMGYSEGSFVPPGQGTPLPVKRWTVKFGFSITYRAVDFNGLDLGVKAPPPAAPKPDAPKPDAPKADPAKPGVPAPGGAAGNPAIPNSPVAPPKPNP